MRLEASSGVQCPPFLTLLSTPPQPSLLASAYKVASGWERLMGLWVDSHHPGDMSHQYDLLKGAQLP